MGCAGDAVSYEASRFGQGLLTYSLLQGMKGAALRDDRYVDVTKLFQYSADNVPLLARDLGGIQRPAVAAPEGTSFDVGALEEEDRQAIPLAAVKPMILRPMFINGDQDEDDLKLSTAVARGLRRASLDDEDGRFVYVDGDDLPGAIRATGKYRLAGSAVTVTVKLRRGEESATWAVEGSAEALPRLVEAIVESIIRKCAEL